MSAVAVTVWPSLRNDIQGEVCAMTLGHSGVGANAGEALNALLANLGPDEALNRIVFRQLGPDEFFGAEQAERLLELSARSRQSREGGPNLSADEQAELEELIEQEEEAVERRSAAISTFLRS